MMDVVAPGGVRADLGAGGARALTRLVAEIRLAFPPLVELYDSGTSLQDRTVATGVLKPALASRFGAGGFVGRASGRAFDARRALPYPPYDRLDFATPVLSDGDVNARVWVRIKEVEQSLGLIEQMLAQLPPGDIIARFDPAGLAAGEGLALVEGFRGDVLVWLRLGRGGVVERCHPRDPSWLQWPLLEAAVEGNIVADFPLCNKSFNCSYAGHDL
jgi:Ni,Fe-hydrogenase III large subunit